jgi:hypothetical protein
MEKYVKLVALFAMQTDYCVTLQLLELYYKREIDETQMMTLSAEYVRIWKEAAVAFFNGGR